MPITPATVTVIALLLTIAGATLKMVYLLGGFVQRVEDHDRRLSDLEDWRRNEHRSIEA